MESVELVTGIITLIPMVIGYTMAGISFVKFIQKKSWALLLSAIIFLSLVSSWIGSSLVFFGAIFGYIPPDYVYIFSYAWAVPVIATTWNYLTATLFKKQNYLKYIILGVFVALDIAFLIGIYALRQFNVDDLSGIYKDSQFLPYSSILLYIYVVSVILFIAPVYIWVGVKTDQRLIKFKSIFIATGSFLFAIVAILDGVIPLSNLILVIVIRLILCVSLVLIFIGFTTPTKLAKRIQAKVNEPEEEEASVSASPEY